MVTTRSLAIAIFCVGLCIACEAFAADREPLLDTVKSHPDLVTWPGIENISKEIVGGCHIVNFGQGVSLDAKNSALCQTKSTQVPANVRPFPLLYSMTSYWLAIAFSEAERSMCGKAQCYSSKNAVSLVIVPDTLPNVQNGVADQDAHRLTLLIPAGIIAILHESTSAYVLESARGMGKDAPPGLDYPQWLDALRGVAQINGAKPLIHGGMNFDSLAPVERAQYTPLVSAAVQTMTGLFQVIFAHELAHVLHGADCGSKSVDPAAIELACDAWAVRTLEATGQQRVALLSHWTHWLVAMHYNDLAYGTLYKKALASPAQPTSDRSLRQMFPGRIWVERADAAVKMNRASIDSDAELSADEKKRQRGATDYDTDMVNFAMHWQPVVEVELPQPAVAR